MGIACHKNNAAAVFYALPGFKHFPLQKDSSLALPTLGFPLRGQTFTKHCRVRNSTKFNILFRNFTCLDILVHTANYPVITGIAQ